MKTPSNRPQSPRRKAVRRPVAPRPKRAGRKRGKISVKRILVPVDFSAHSRKAVPYAAGIAVMYGAEIELLHVVEPMAFVEDLVLPSSIAMLDRKHRNKAAEALEKMADELVPPTVKRRLKVILGHVYPEILKEADKSHADLMILNTHGYTGLQEFFMGGTAEKIVRHAHCPVLVLKPGKP